MNKISVIFALVFLMLINATMLQAFMDPDEWGEYWDRWPVKPGEVFAQPQIYWFNDNVDFRDTLKYSINYTDSEDYEGQFIFVAYGLWDDPYHHSYQHEYHIYNESAHSDTMMVGPFFGMEPEEYGKGYFYVVKYTTPNGCEYSQTDNNEVTITTSRSAIEHSGVFSLIDAPPSDLQWYDIELEDVDFDPNQFCVV